jgi:hypothetical protein
MNTKKIISATFLVGIFLAATVALHASQILLTPASVIGGSDTFAGAWNAPFSPAGDFNALNVADDQTGPVVDIFGTNYWLGPQGSAQAYFVLDLGAVYNFQSVDLFNTHNNGDFDRATGDFQIYVSNSITSTPTNGMDLVGASLALSGTLIITGDPIPAQSFNFGPGISAQYLRFNAVSIAADTIGAQGVGLNEIRVFSTPETGSSLALLGIAAGIIGLASRIWKPSGS